MSIRTPLVRRVPILAAISLVALAGCGSDEPSAARDTSPPVATDATPTDTDAHAGAVSDDLRTPQPIEVTSSGPGGTATEASATGDSRVALDMMIAATYVADFVVADGLSLPDNTTGYVYDASADVTAEQALEVAAYFGVQGDAVRVDDWDPGGWQVGPTDGSGPSVFVSDDGQISWSYSAPWADQPGFEGCGVSASDVPESSAVLDTAPCPEPQPPAGVPSAEEAEVKARELLAAMGVDPAILKIDTYADEWSASVNFTEFVDGQIDGIPTGRYWGFGFGAEGALQYANGSLGTPQPVGPYELIDLETAVARLREQYAGSGAPMPIDLVDPATSDMVGGDVAVTDAATSDMVDAPEPRPTDVSILPAPTDTFPAPEPITVTLVDVQADLWWAWDAEGSVWMVPAYRFIGDDGGWYTVPAVTDEYLVHVAPGTTDPAPEPMPAPPSTVAPEGTDTALTELVGLPLDEFTAAAGELGYSVVVVYDEATRTVADTLPPTGPQVGVHTWSVDGVDVVRLIAVVHQGPDTATTVAPVVEPDEASALEPLVGLSIEEFGANAEAMGWKVRVAEIDGQPQALTMDFQPSRVNVAVSTNADGTQTVTGILNIG